MIESTGTYHAGYAVATLIYLAYTFSLWRRAKKLRDAASRRENAE